MSQVWFITGASRGLGRAIAEAALAAGHSVVATSRSGNFGHEAINYGDQLLSLPLDVSVSDESSYRGAVEAALEKFGRIDVLVNNAGFGQLTFFEETDEAQLRAVFETNVFGLMRMTRAVLPVMRQQKSGHVFNISSLAGYVGGNAMYSSTKFAVTGFSESLAFELKPFGIKVTNVAPGYFRTDFLDSSSLKGEPAISLVDYAPSREAISVFIAQANHKQGGDPNALGRLLVDVAQSSSPPVHLPVGQDAIAAIAEREKGFQQDIADWQARSVDTSFDKARTN